MFFISHKWKALLNIFHNNKFKLIVISKEEYLKVYIDVGFL